MPQGYHLMIPAAQPPALSFTLHGQTIVVGRDHAGEVIVQGMGVSRRHATIALLAGGPVLEDAGSLCGVRVNGVPVQRAILRDGDIVTLGVAEIEVRIDTGVLRLMQTRREESCGAGEDVEVPDSAVRVRIGRDPSNDVVAAHPLVSRYHAEMHRNASGAYVLADLRSTNGTFVNGQAIHERLLREGDVVQVGPFRFSLAGGRLFRADDGNTIAVEAIDVSVRSRGRELLRHVSLGMHPGEFVVILGPSGAGKTTLVNALAGRVAVSQGQILYNGLPLRRFIQAFSSRIGYVSQENLLYPELTVWETFCEQSLLRLPRDSIPAEHHARIEEVLHQLDIGALRRQRVGKLSGGEAKRVHLGIELLSSPTLVFLDEPLAGLDAGLVRRFMELFRSLCCSGRTLVVTTHTLDRLELCDRVALVHQGTLLYNGMARDMPARLGTDSIAGVYESARLGAIASPAHSGTGESPRPARRALLQRSAVRAPRAKSVPTARQISVLLRRYLKILARDWRSCALVAAQIPLIALLLRCVYQGDTDFLPVSFYFSIAVASIWCGGANAIREIAREWLHFDREYRAGVSILAFAISKLAVAWLVAAVQALAFMLLLAALFAKFSLDGAHAAILLAASLAGALLGLAVSAISENVRQAVAWLPIVFIPQIFLSGILLPFDRMPLAGRVLSRCTVSRPVFALFKHKDFLDASAWRSGEWWWLLSLCAGLFILLLAGIRVRRFFQRW